MNRKIRLNLLLEVDDTVEDIEISYDPYGQIILKPVNVENNDYDEDGKLSINDVDVINSYIV